MSHRFVFATAGVLGVGMFSGCGGAVRPISSQNVQARGTKPPSSTQGSNRPSTPTASSTPRRNSSPSPSASSRTTYSSSELGSPRFLLVFPPHIVAQVYGGGIGGNSAFLGTIHSNPSGLITPPTESGWYYTIQYRNETVSLVNTPTGPRITIPQDIPYQVFAWLPSKQHRRVASGNSGPTGNVSLPSLPDQYLAITYPANHIQTSITLYEPGQPTRSHNASISSNARSSRPPKPPH